MNVKVDPRPHTHTPFAQLLVILFGVCFWPYIMIISVLKWILLKKQVIFIQLLETPIGQLLPSAALLPQNDWIAKYSIDVKSVKKNAFFDPSP